MEHDPGLHVLVALKAATFDGELRKLLQTLRPAGVILRKEVFLAEAPYEVWLEGLDTLLSNVKGAIGRERILVAVDHEGGRVNRFPAPVTRFPYPIFFREKALEVGRAMGRELRSLGVNLVLSPVADIHTNPNNPVIGPRSFGRNAEEVSRYSTAFLKGIHESGLLTCAKHFPGHGDTHEDSHFTLPRLSLSVSELQKRELLPFGALIREGVPAVMTSHIVVESIDDQTPASLSEKVNRELLREKLGFLGIVIGDDFDMEAIRTNFTLERIADLFVRSTSDLAIFYHLPERALEFSKELERVARIDPESSRLILQSRERIELFLQKACESCISKLPDGPFREHQKLADSLETTDEFDSVQHSYTPK